MRDKKYENTHLQWSSVPFPCSSLSQCDSLPRDNQFSQYVARCLVFQHHGLQDNGSLEQSEAAITLFSYSAIPSGITPDARFNRCYIKYNLDFIPQGAFSGIKMDETH